jgi:hypothetical protein
MLTPIFRQRPRWRERRREIPNRVRTARSPVDASAKIGTVSAEPAENEFVKIEKKVWVLVSVS